MFVLEQWHWPSEVTPTDADLLCLRVTEPIFDAIFRATDAEKGLGVTPMGSYSKAKYLRHSQKHQKRKHRFFFFKSYDGP